MRLRTFVLAAIALTGSASLASADVITDTLSYGPTPTNWGSGGSVSLSFPGFNTSLGTLTGIEITATQTTNGSFTAINNSTTPGSYQTRLENTFQLTLPSPLHGSTIIKSTTYTSWIRDLLIPAGQSGSSHIVTASSSAYATWTSGDALSPYESPFTIGVTDTGAVTIQALLGKGYATYTDSGKVSVTVEYTYTAAAIPAAEPATFWVVGMGILGLRLVRRRRV
jgi:hypothetical protein